ncbi:hypothetical protein ACNKHM_03030 [Shigella sonnei]
MTNHVYFNLDGEQSDVRNHKLQILAEEYLPLMKAAFRTTA